MLLHKQVPLRNRKGEIVAVALVSDEDYERVASLNWCLGGAVHGTDRRYARRNFNGKTTYMHRFVMALSRADKDVEVDHINGCLLYTSDAADERSSVDLGGRRIIKKK